MISPSRGENLDSLNATVTLGFIGEQNIADLAGNVLANTTPSGTNDDSFVVENDASTSSIEHPESGTFVIIASLNDVMFNSVSGTINVGDHYDRGAVHEASQKCGNAFGGLDGSPANAPAGYSSALQTVGGVSPSGTISSLTFVTPGADATTRTTEPHCLYKDSGGGYWSFEHALMTNSSYSGITACRSTDTFSPSAGCSAGSGETADSGSGGTPAYGSEELNKVNVGSQYNAPQAESYCTANFGAGTHLYIPRSQSDLARAWALANSGDDQSSEYLRIMGIYPKFNGARCDGKPFNSDTPNCDWRAGDDGPFWVSDTFIHNEPNGDNRTDASMLYYAWNSDGTIAGYNDIGGHYTSSRFICQGAGAAVASDITAPRVVSIVRNTPNASPTNADSLTWRVTFNEDVQYVDAADFTRSGTTGTLSVGTVSATTYDVTLSGGDMAELNATVTLGFAGGQNIVDLAGNALTNTTPSGTNTPTFVVQNDTIAPTLTISDLPATNVPVTATFTFSEPVTGFEVGDIALGYDATASNFSGSGTTYTALITPTSNGDVTIDVAADSAQDGAGNGNEVATTKTFSFSNTIPTLAVVTPVATATSDTSPLFTFSSDISGQLTIAGACGATPNTAPAGNITVTLKKTDNVSDLAQGTYDNCTVTLTDGFGNVSASLAIPTFTIDTTAPSVAITGVQVTTNAPFTATFTFDEAVSGFEVGDITLDNATASVFTGSGASYSALITPTADGALTLDIAVNVAQDAAGNTNTAATQANTTYDGTRPTILIGGVPLTTNTAFTASFTFSESVNGFLIDDISLSNATASAFSGSGNSYTALITPTNEGAVTVGIAQNIALDAFGNGNEAAGDASSGYDATAPSVVISSVSTTTNTAFTATFTFDETVTGFDIDDITLGNGTASGFTGSGTSYSALITPVSDGTVTINVATGVALDVTGNGNSAATQVSSSYDGTAPSVAITGVPSITNAAFTATITFSENVNDFVVGDITLGNATASAFSGSGTSYSALITPSTDGAVTVDINENVATDNVGNGNTAAQASTSYDGTVPTLAISGVPATTNAAFTASFTFSESVSGFALGDITLSNATASAFSGSGSSYSALITPASDGTLTIDVAANAAADASGNGNSAASQAVASYDNSGPSVIIEDAPTTVASGNAFNVQINFSESVTGFELGDMSVTNGSASSLAGNGASYTLNITPNAKGDITLNVAANAAVDAVGNPNTAAQTVTISCATGCSETKTVQYTQRSIRAFASNRVVKITGAGPKLSRRVTGSGTGGFSGPVGFAAFGTKNNYKASFSTSLNQVLKAQADAQRQNLMGLAGGLTPGQQSLLANATKFTPAPANIWVSGQFTRAYDKRSGVTEKSDFSILYAGLDMKLTDNLLIGILGQLDRSDQQSDSTNLKASGHGWMAGPYISARVTDSVVFDVRGAWGQSKNKIDPLGLYVDKFETERWLVEGNLTGTWIFDNWRISPSVGLTYFEEQQKAYVDSLGFTVPSQTVALGSLTFGPEFGYSFKTKNGFSVEPHMALKGVYDFVSPTIDDVNGIAVGTNNVRAQVQGGLAVTSKSGVKARANFTYDGLGLDDFTSYTGDLTLSIPFH